MRVSPHTSRVLKVALRVAASLLALERALTHQQAGGYTKTKVTIFGTAIAVQINAESNRLVYANAGHPHAMLFRDGSHKQSLDSTTR